MKWFFIWLLRVLTPGIIVFSGLLAYDLLAPDYRFWQTLAALFMHLVPGVAFIAVVMFARFKAFSGDPIFFTILNYCIFRARADLLALLLIVSPTVLIGLPFIVSQNVRTRKINEAPF